MIMKNTLRACFASAIFSAATALLSGCDGAPRETITLAFGEGATEEAIKATPGILRERLITLGTRATIKISPDKRLSITLPASANPALITQALTAPGHLTFRLVHKDNAALAKALLSGDTPIEGHTRAVTLRGEPCLVRDNTYATLIQDPAYLERLGRTAAPSAPYDLMFEKAKETTVTNENAYFPTFILRTDLLTGEAVKQAKAARDHHGLTPISLTFKDAKAFNQITADFKPFGRRNQASSQGRRLAIILDGLILSAPAIQGEIPNGTAEITGNFTREEATLIAAIINAPLPAPLKIVKEK